MPETHYPKLNNIEAYSLEATADQSMSFQKSAM